MTCKKSENELPENNEQCVFEEAQEETVVVPADAEAVELQSEQPAENAEAEVVTAEEETAEESAEDGEEESAEESAEDGEEESAEESAEEGVEDGAEYNIVGYEDEPEEKKKVKLWVIILAAVAGVALLAVLVGAILFGLGVNPFMKNELTAKENYTVEDAVAGRKANVVVATMGDESLTSGELQIYYWESVTNFVNQNYYYLSMYGLDISQPLNEQTCPLAEGQTWQQFFLEMALNSWQRYTTLQVLAQESDFVIEEDMRTFLDSLPETMQSNAGTYGYDSVQAWLEDNCGPGVSEAGYIEYVTAYYEGTFFLTSKYDEMNPTAEEAEVYFTENEQTFADQGVTKDGKYYDVRHILISVEGGTEDEEGTIVYSDEEWAACRQEAQDLLDQWAADDGTEDGFANLASQYSADGGSSSNGGLYEKLTAETNFVQEFKDWYLNSSRKPGDTGLVKSTYGYHIMYFSGSSDIWLEAATEELLAKRVSDYIDEGMEKYPMKVNYRKIILGDHALVG